MALEKWPTPGRKSFEAPIIFEGLSDISAFTPILCSFFFHGVEVAHAEVGYYKVAHKLANYLIKNIFIKLDSKFFISKLNKRNIF